MDLRTKAHIALLNLETDIAYRRALKHGRKAEKLGAQYAKQEAQQKTISVENCFGLDTSSTDESAAQSEADSGTSKAFTVGLTTAIATAAGVPGLVIVEWIRKKQ